MLAALAGLAAGFVHVLSGPDHLAAVAPFATDHESRRWRVGLQWGLGHTAGVIVIGVLLATFRELLPLEVISALGERAVGVALVGVGVWSVVRAQSDRLHTHPTDRASFAMGTLHGLAGSSHLFGVLPALAFGTQMAALSYLFAFGFGAILAMTVFTGAVGALALRARRNGINTHRSLLYACSISAFLAGGFWLFA